MSEMVERVARALAKADGKNPDKPAWATSRGESFGLCWRDQYADKARAAIEEMREPTDDMRWAGYTRAAFAPESTNVSSVQFDAKPIWELMIDKALE